MTRYTIRYQTTPASPASARTFESSVTYSSRRAAQRAADLYLATYPERAQVARIVPA